MTTTITMIAATTTIATTTPTMTDTDAVLPRKNIYSIKPTDWRGIAEIIIH